MGLVRTLSACQLLLCFKIFRYLRSRRRAVQALLHLLLRLIAIYDLDRLYRLAGTILRGERSFEHSVKLVGQL